MKIILDGCLEGLTTRTDNSVVLKFSTQELDSSKAGELFQLRNKYCKVLISDSNISTLEAELVDGAKLVGEKKKTPSQRLRAVLFRLHEQSGLQTPFDDYYTSEIGRIVEHFKTKLQ